MQKRCAPPALAAFAATMTVSRSISFSALRPVLNEADWLQ